MIERNIQQDILHAMEASMQGFGWSLRSLQGLPRAYAHDQLVTPYMVCSHIVHKPYGDYVPECDIGVIHQGFEQLWMRDPARSPKEQGFGAIADMVMFPGMIENRYINPNSSIAPQVERFCTLIKQILDRMPDDESKLVDAFKKGEMGGISVNSYVGWHWRPKYGAFRRFVEDLGMRP
jgi:hypothetical protein